VMLLLLAFCLHLFAACMCLQLHLSAVTLV